MNGRAKRFCGVVAGVIGVVLAAGCMRTRYVHVNEDGTTWTSTSPHDHARQRVVRVEDIGPAEGRPLGMAGTWKGRLTPSDLRGGLIRLELVRRTNGATHTRVIWLSVPEQDAGGADLVIARQVGTLVFADAQVDTADKPLRFEGDANAARELAELTKAPIDGARLFDLFLVDLDLAYVRAIQEAGYAASLDDIVRMRQAGVVAEYAAGLRSAGYAFAPPDVIRLRHAGVSTDYAARLREAKYDLPAEQIIRLRHSGVPEEFAGEIAAAGYAMAPEELIRLRHAGVTARYAAVLRDAGYRFGVEDLVRLRHRGVGEEYAATLRKAGYEFSAEELVRLRHGGVGADYAAALVLTDRQNLSAEDLIHLRQRGVSADAARSLRR